MAFLRLLYCIRARKNASGSAQGSFHLVCAHTCVWELEASPPWAWLVNWGVVFSPLVLKAWHVLSAPLQSTSSIEMWVLKSRCLQWIWHCWQSWLVFWQQLQFLLRLSDQRIPCVSWMDLCGGVWSHGLGSAEKTAQGYCWTGFDAYPKIFNSVDSICFLSLLLPPPVYKVMML